jgi:hypothetical protein
MSPDGPEDDLDWAEEDLGPMDLVIDAWEGLGWLSVLPRAAAEMLDGVDEVTNSRSVLIEASTGSAVPGVTPLDGDPLWPVLAEDTYPDQDDDEDSAADEPPLPSFAEYVGRQRELRQRWRELLERQGEPTVETADELISLLVRWGLLREKDAGGTPVVEFVDEPPDPVELLPLSEEALAEFAMDELANDVDAVLDGLHDLLYHSDDSEQTIRIGQFAERVGVDPEQVALTFATLVADPESGITAHRRGPNGEQQLTAGDFETLPEHARFVLRVDRSAPGFPEHGED